MSGFRLEQLPLSKYIATYIGNEKLIKLICKKKINIENFFFSIHDVLQPLTPTHTEREQWRENTNSQALVIEPLRNPCSTKTWRKYFWDLVSNGSCEEESCYYSRIYYTLLSAERRDGKGEETDFFYCQRGLWSCVAYLLVWARVRVCGLTSASWFCRS